MSLTMIHKLLQQHIVDAAVAVSQLDVNPPGALVGQVGGCHSDHPFRRGLHQGQHGAAVNGGRGHVDDEGDGRALHHFHL